MVENNQPLLVKIKMKRHNLAFCNFQLIDYKSGMSIPEAQIEICDADAHENDENGKNKFFYKTEKKFFFNFFHL
jgi:hypothetical protein